MAKVARRRDRYVVDFYDQYGKRRWHTMPKGSTRKEAQEKMGDLLKSVGQGHFVPVGKVPKFSAVADAWLDSKAQNVRGSTHGNYDTHIRKHLKPFFESFRIDRVNFDLVEKYKKHALEQGTTFPTLKKILTTLGQVMKHAKRMRLIDYIPEIEKPRGEKLHADRQKLSILDPAGIRALLDKADGQRDRVLFMTAVLTGMRQGELFALQWGDIDWLKSQAIVCKTYNHFKVYEPKSETSRRRIDLAPELVRALTEWKIACPISDHDLVFPTSLGTYENSANTFYRRFIPALRRAGLPRMRFHDLRHTYASLLIDQGENIKYISSQLGHASCQLTLDVYGHLLKDTNQGAASRLGRAVLGDPATGAATITSKNTMKNPETVERGRLSVVQ